MTHLDPIEGKSPVLDNPGANLIVTFFPIRKLNCYAFI